ncbi:hypothetical protein A3Q56_08165 [Intoshia linei]|uniref:Uncharacterized protein n=1 Tax=Intoshia linei TaxID=1819745 RepID=A0A177AQP3_9BILA|nr:hypothetical protein A3Q56_08165 [Intoshia linei]
MDRPFSIKTLHNRVKLKELAKICGPGREIFWFIKKELLRFFKDILVISKAREKHELSRLRQNERCQKYREAKRLRLSLNSTIP